MPKKKTALSFSVKRVTKIDIKPGDTVVRATPTEVVTFRRAGEGEEQDFHTIRICTYSGGSVAEYLAGG